MRWGNSGKLFGFTIKAGGIIPRLVELVEKVDDTHLPTLAVGLGSFAVLLISPRLLPRVRAALLAMVLAAVAVGLLGLDARGVETVGAVPAGMPALIFPRVPLDTWKPLIGDAASIALISFTSLMLTARSFASKNGYDIDADRDLAALGAANIAAAVSQGFAVSGADSDGYERRCGRPQPSCRIVCRGGDRPGPPLSLLARCATRPKPRSPPRWSWRLIRS